MGSQPHMDQMWLDQQSDMVVKRDPAVQLSLSTPCIARKVPSVELIMRVNYFNEPLKVDIFDSALLASCLATVYPAFVETSMQCGVRAAQLLCQASNSQNIPTLLNSSDPSFQHLNFWSSGCVSQGIVFGDTVAPVFIYTSCCHFVFCLVRTPNMLVSAAAAAQILAQALLLRCMCRPNPMWFYRYPNNMIVLAQHNSQWVQSTS